MRDIPLLERQLAGAALDSKLAQKIGAALKLNEKTPLHKHYDIMRKALAKLRDASNASANDGVDKWNKDRRDLENRLKKASRAVKDAHDAFEAVTAAMKADDEAKVEAAEEERKRALDEEAKAESRAKRQRKPGGAAKETLIRMGPMDGRWKGGWYSGEVVLKNENGKAAAYFCFYDGGVARAEILPTEDMRPFSGRTPADDELDEVEDADVAEAEWLSRRRDKPKPVKLPRRSSATPADFFETFERLAPRRVLSPLSMLNRAGGFDFLVRSGFGFFHSRARSEDAAFLWGLKFPFGTVRRDCCGHTSQNRVRIKIID